MHVFMPGIWLCTCACIDMYRSKIPNWVICLGFFASTLVQAGGGVMGGLMAVTRCLVVLCILFPIYMVRMAGAGDIKMLAVLAGMTGMRTGCAITVIAILLAAPVCLGLLLVRRNLIQRFCYFFAYLRHTVLTKQVTAYYDPARDGYQDTIPFAVFLFMGYLYYIHKGGNI